MSSLINNKQKSPLYALVFSSWKTWPLVFLVLSFFILQPLTEVFASETNPGAGPTASGVEQTNTAANQTGETAVTGVSANSTIEESVSTSDPASASEGPVIESESTNPGDADQPGDLNNDLPLSVATGTISPTDSSPASGTSPAATEASSSNLTSVPDSSTVKPRIGGENTSDGSPSDNTISTTSSTLASSTTDDEGVSGLTTVETTPDQGVDNVPLSSSTEILDIEVTSSTTNEVVVDDSEQSGTPEDTLADEASTTPTTIPTLPDNIYTFDKSQCVAIGDGTFHCFDATRAVKAVNDEQVVYAARDEGGDFEVFMNDDGVRQLTNNDVDDTQAVYDPVSDSVVWTQTEDGSSAIYSYKNDQTELVSDPAANSMEPDRWGNYTVWQQWAGETWQVMLWDGSDEPKLISEPGLHNLAPHIQDGYVLWSVTDGSLKKIAVYEIKTGLRSVIDDGDDVVVDNPRFVLVYDSKFANGDVVTKGYDAATGEVVPLAAQPAVPNREIPKSDQTGETRALIQSKTQSREEVDVDLLPHDQTASSTGNNGISSNASSSVVTTASSTADTAPTTTVPSIDMTVSSSSEVLTLTDFDLIVPSFSDALTPAQTTTVIATTSTQ